MTASRLSFGVFSKSEVVKTPIDELGSNDFRNVDVERAFGDVMFGLSSEASDTEIDPFLTLVIDIVMTSQRSKAAIRPGVDRAVNLGQRNLDEESSILSLMPECDVFTIAEPLKIVGDETARAPLDVDLFDVQVTDDLSLTFPPPAAGRTLLHILHLLDQFQPKRRQPDTPEGAMLLAEVIRRANLDRRDRPFDPAFYAQVDDRRLLSDDYAKLTARQIRSRIKTHGETTHLSVMDAEGNAVALTQSIERVYGSFAASPELGFLYNNYMTAFEHEDISHPYYLRPNAVPWASVAPTFVMRNRRPWLALGSPGSERIASSIAVESSNSGARCSA